MCLVLNYNNNDYYYCYGIVFGYLRAGDDDHPGPEVEGKLVEGLDDGEEINPPCVAISEPGTCVRLRPTEGRGSMERCKE